MFREKEKERLIKKASEHYAKYMDVLIPGWRLDPNSKDTPLRVAKAFVNDIAKSLYCDFPQITSFDNIDKYDGIVLQSNINVRSLCSHHHQNIYGVCHAAYIPSPEGKIIGLSKLNRIVDFFSSKPAVQENLTMQIHSYIDKMCEKNLGVAVIIRARHMCCSHRGIKQNSEMQTVKVSGAFYENKDGCKDELFNLINYATKVPL